ncbi:hypothetical protein AZF04_09425 [Alkalihalobacillus trypoxylicola]|uniref:Atrophied bacterial Ig domain-containing protein n=2 Tax=Alkalihalobacillus trypoxylicola TaxID=519424 RepID=A0A161P9C0_9BACI|nr:immunoglobulin-like domain-containing protein [Alkalihalobacillus trypoxylicola]KYG28114.1 hypothetical protein AZF04_09425 [Alkalihalobacillus trypoxylicola]
MKMYVPQSKKWIHVSLVVLLLLQLFLPNTLIAHANDEDTENDSCSYGGARAELGGENGTELFLGGNFIELGISNWGDFGSLGDKPNNFRGTLGGETSPGSGSNKIGMSADHDGFCNGRDLPVDYYLPGTPEERFAVGYQIGSATKSNTNAAQMNDKNMPTVVTNESNTEKGELKAKAVSLWEDEMEITQQISFKTDDKFYRNVVTIKNISEEDWDGARYMRSFDPDNSQYRGGLYDTDNTVTHTVAEDGKSVVKAETFSDTDPLYLAFGSRIPIFFYSNDSNVKASIFGFSNKNPYAAAAYDTPVEKNQTIRDDVAITITWDSGVLKAGESKSFTYYTSLDERDFSDVEVEIVVDDIKEDIADIETMDDVREVKDRIDDEDILEDSKKKELKLDLLEEVIDKRVIDIRHEGDIIIIRDIINETDLDDDDKDDARLIFIERIKEDLDELTEEEKKATDELIDDIVDPTKRAEAERLMMDDTAAPKKEQIIINATDGTIEVNDVPEGTEVKVYRGDEILVSKVGKDGTVTFEDLDLTEGETLDITFTIDGHKESTKTAQEAKVRSKSPTEEEMDLNADSNQLTIKDVPEGTIIIVYDDQGEEVARKTNTKDSVSDVTITFYDKNIKEGQELTIVFKEKGKLDSTKTKVVAKNDLDDLKERYLSSDGEESDTVYKEVAEAEEDLNELINKKASEDEIEKAIERLKEKKQKLSEETGKNEKKQAIEKAKETILESEKEQEHFTNIGGEKETPEYQELGEAKKQLKQLLEKEDATAEELLDDTFKLKEKIAIIKVLIENKESELALKDLQEAKEAAEKAVKAALDSQNEFKEIGGDVNEPIHQDVEKVKEELKQLLENENVTADKIRKKTLELKEKTGLLEVETEKRKADLAQQELEEAKKAAEDSIKNALEKQNRYQQLGGDKKDSYHSEVEKAKQALEEILEEDPLDKEKLQEATYDLKEKTKLLEVAIKDKEEQIESEVLKAIVEAAEKAIKDANQTKDRFVQIVGEKENPLYLETESLRNKLQNLLKKQPLNKDEILKTTLQLEKSTALLEIAIEKKQAQQELEELNKAKQAAEEALTNAKNTQKSYENVGGSKQEATYSKIEDLKKKLEALLTEGNKTEEIRTITEQLKNQTAQLEKTVNSLNNDKKTAELSNQIGKEDSPAALIEIKKEVDASQFSDKQKETLYQNINTRLKEISFVVNNPEWFEEIIDVIGKTNQSAANKQKNYVNWVEKGIDDMAQSDKPSANDVRFTKKENQVLWESIQLITNNNEKQRLVNSLDLTIDYRALTMATAFKFAKGDTWESITSNFLVLNTGDYGTKVSWTSSDQKVINISGNEASIERQVRDRSILVTALLKKGDIELEKTFLLVVKSELMGDKVITDSKRQVVIEANGFSQKPLAIQRIHLLDRDNKKVVNKIDKLIIDNEMVPNDILEPLSIYLPDDTTDLADEIAIEIPLSVLEKIKNSLTINTDQGSIKLSKETIEQMIKEGKDLFLRIVPIREDQERQNVNDRLKNHPLVLEELNDKETVKMIGIPREIETNYKGFETEVILPLDVSEIDNLENVRIFIEHTDGERKVIKGEFVRDENGQITGISFVINKFSTFTIFEITDDTSENGSEPTPEQPSEESGQGTDNEEQNNENENNQDNKDQKTEDDKGGESLPSTATSNYQTLFIGLSLTLLAGMIFILSKRRKVHQQ